MAEILDTKSPIIFDDSISSYEYHVHQPYAASNFNNNDKIRIIIQNQEHYLLPCKSLIHIKLYSIFFVLNLLMIVKTRVLRH